MSAKPQTVRVQAQNLMASIHWELNGIDHWTGTCQACGKPSRGVARCVDCLAENLNQLLHSIIGTEYVAHCERLRKSEVQVMQQADEMDTPL